MYNKEQLNGKELPELLAIAQSLGIKKPESYKKDDLVYRILDEQAVASSSTKAASEEAARSAKKDNNRKRVIRADHCFRPILITLFLYI